MFRGSGLGAFQDLCDAKDSRGIPSYPYGKKSAWTEDAQRFSNKYLDAAGLPKIPVTGVLDAKSCAAFNSICEEQERIMDFPMKLQSIRDPENCDRIPCYIDACAAQAPTPSTLRTGILRRTLDIVPDGSEEPGSSDDAPPGPSPGGARYLIAGAVVASVSAFAAWKWWK
jgi:hypothetical protein